MILLIPLESIYFPSLIASTIVLVLVGFLFSVSAKNIFPSATAFSMVEVLLIFLFCTLDAVFFAIVLNLFYKGFLRIAFYTKLRRNLFDDTNNKIGDKLSFMKKIKNLIVTKVLERILK